MAPRTSKQRRSFGCDKSFDDSCTQSSFAAFGIVPCPYVSGVMIKERQKGGDALARY